MTFDFISSPKAQHVLVNVFFGKIIENMKVNFDITTG
jgi:hypothetical protein